MIDKERFGEVRLNCSLDTPLRRALFVSALSLAGLLLGYNALRIGVAAALGSWGNTAGVRLAIAFDPANARYFERMGRLDQSSLNAGATEAIPWFQRAVAIDPESGTDWQRLALACEFAGKMNCAADSFSRALSLYPMDPRLLWLAANQKLLAGLDDGAGAYFRRLLQMDPGYANAVFGVCLRAYGNPYAVGERILSGDPSDSVKLAYVNFLAERNDFSPANRFWSGLASGRHAFDFSQADPYLEKLIASGRIAEAAAAWHDLERWGILASGDGDADNNLIFNPGFERSPLNAGFDWRLSRLSSVNVEFADPSAHDGARCLRIDFIGGEHHAIEPAYQLVPVSGGQTYRLTAWVRSLAIASGSGPRLRLTDPLHIDCPPVETPGVVGTSPWHEMSVTFTTCPGTNLLRLSIWLPRDDAFGETPGGHLWLDDVTLEAQSQTHPAATQSAKR